MRSCEQLYTIIATAKFSIAPVSAELMYDGLIDVIASESSAAILLASRGELKKKERNFLGSFLIRRGRGNFSIPKLYNLYFLCPNHFKEIKFT